MGNLGRIIAVTATMCAAIAACPLPSAHASNAEEADYLARINDERRAHGLRALREKTDLDRVAQRWSEHMADANRLQHNPRLTRQVTGWRVVGENVGEGGTIRDLDAAFMASPEHRANVLDRDYTQVGIGTVRRDGILWITVDFRRPDRSRQTSPALRPTVTAATAETAEASDAERFAVDYPMLSIGSVGPPVVTLQRLLGVVPDGIFGPQTQWAVVRYQRARDLLVDGIVGPQTWGSLLP